LFNFSAQQAVPHISQETTQMLEMLIVEGNLLEVTVQEKDILYDILRSCCPTDYGQAVFGFPVSLLLKSLYMQIQSC
jgi:hypothetical protein